MDPEPRKIRLEQMLHELSADTPPQLTVGMLVDKAAEGGFAFLVGMLTLIAIPFFGLSTPFGLAIALVGAQMMIGLRHPWLPKRTRKRVLKPEVLERVTRILAKRTRWIAKSTRRRHEWLIRPRLVGFGIFLLAIGLALPLPIPGSNLVFLVPLFIYAVGVLERDGLWIIAGHVALLIDAALIVAFGRTVLVVLERIWHWVF